MRRFRSLLIDRANLRLAGLHVLSFAVHRHLTEHASVSAHQHPWSQAILYLTGSGRQRIGPADATIVPGTVVVLPPHVSHAFVRDGRPPLCVMVDFRIRGGRRHRPVVRALNRSQLADIRQKIAHLLKLQRGARSALRWDSAVPVLQTLLTLLRAANWIEQAPPAAVHESNPAVRSLLDRIPAGGPLAATVAHSGYHRDHLNRLVKRETGLTLGQYRGQQRLRRARELLSAGMKVGEVGAAIGLADPGYFARWFRRQTGQTPTAWAGRRRAPQER